MENVPELLSENHREYFSLFKGRVEHSGYLTSCNVINVAEHGVPQDRFRAVVLEVWVLMQVYLLVGLKLKILELSVVHW